MSKKTYDRHHRKPRSIGGTNKDDNISVVNRKKHAAWHLLFANKSAEEICKEINDKWIDPDYIIIPIYFQGRLTSEEIHNLIRKLQKSIP